MVKNREQPRMITIHVRLSTLAAQRRAVLAVIAALSACTREGPPEIPEWKLSGGPAAAAKIEEVEEVAAPVEAAAAAPAPPEMIAAAPVLAPGPPPKPVETPPVPKAPETPQKPSIIGTWRVAQASEGDKPMPPGMDMRFSFAADGTMTMSMTMNRPDAPEPTAHTKTGTYSLADDTITLSFDRETKSGTLTFEGPDRVRIEVERVKFVLERM
ncbi:MAG: hypothetical protein AMXMBFR83_16780 [Phycisphaerae bacterium]